MKIPKYWRYIAKDETINGKSYCIVGWGYSDASPEEAVERANERLRRNRELIQNGKRLDTYEYHADPIREERLQVFDDEENPMAIITRNGYGARVLNTARVMFVDIDLPPVGLFSRLFGGKEAPRQKAISKVDAWVDAHRDAGFRVYETPAGLRLIATHRTFDPASKEADDILVSLGSDALYRKLCSAQNCFRARLSAKPWRIGLARSPVRFPDEHSTPRLASWVATYEQQAAPYSACRFLKSIGTNAFNSEIDRIVSIHDAESGALSATQLA